jgi:alpha-methylacyl-CoA racemase
MRCQQMGAACLKIEPLPPAGAPKGTPADPMGLYNRAAYDVLHSGVEIIHADLKCEEGQTILHDALAQSDILITSFRNAALAKLGLEWVPLHRRYPNVSMVSIVGAPGSGADKPGHDLTYLAENDLVTGLDLPPTLYADMGGSLMASEAVLQARLMQLKFNEGVRLEVALINAARHLALPRAWGLTQPGAAVGGGHAGYKVYPCKDGRVAIAALEPHFAAALATEVGLKKSHIMAMFLPETHEAIAQFFSARTRTELDALAIAKDIPLFTMA